MEKVNMPNLHDPIKAHLASLLSDRVDQFIKKSTTSQDLSSKLLEELKELGDSLKEEICHSIKPNNLDRLLASPKEIISLYYYDESQPSSRLLNYLITNNKVEGIKKLLEIEFFSVLLSGGFKGRKYHKHHYSERRNPFLGKAIAAGHLELVKLFLEIGVNLQETTVGSIFFEPSRYLRERYSDSVLKIMEFENYEGNALLWAAAHCKNNTKEMIKLLQQQKLSLISYEYHYTDTTSDYDEVRHEIASVDRFTPIDVAITYKNTLAIFALIELGVPLSDWNSTIIQYAISRDDVDLLSLSLSTLSINDVNTQVESKLTPNSYRTKDKENYQFTLLELVQFNNAEHCMGLLEKKFNLTHEQIANARVSVFNKALSCKIEDKKVDDMINLLVSSPVELSSHPHIIEALKMIANEKKIPPGLIAIGNQHDAYQVLSIEDAKELKEWAYYQHKNKSCCGGIFNFFKEYIPGQSAWIQGDESNEASSKFHLKKYQ